MMKDLDVNLKKSRRVVLNVVHMMIDIEQLLLCAPWSDGGP